MNFNRAIKTDDKQEESGELGRKMDDRKGDGDGGFVHTLFFFVKINALCVVIYHSGSNDFSL